MALLKGLLDLSGKAIFPRHPALQGGGGVQAGPSFTSSISYGSTDAREHGETAALEKNQSSGAKQDTPQAQSDGWRAPQLTLPFCLLLWVLTAQSAPIKEKEMPQPVVLVGRIGEINLFN